MLLALAFAPLGCFVIDDKANTPMNPADAEPRVFEVPPGATAKGLGPALVQAGLVDSEWTWKLWLRRSGSGGCLKAGRFKVSPAMALPELMETLCGAPLPNDEPFTIPEGWRIREIDAALAERGWIEAGAYARAAGEPARFKLPEGIGELSSLEGLLYPETYMVDPLKFSVDTFIQRQLDTFTERLGPSPNLGQRTLYEVVIMASMLEREEPTPANRPLVAGILWKRIDSQWNLGVDATSRYTLAEWNDRDAFLKRLRDPDDPYNTRLRPGLPPTPIGNPNADSLQAAMNPVASEYWYYLHDKDGVLHPSRNAAEHQSYRQKYGIW
ncbi:endolytic transglycosylase MltG [Myxococcota bacterium]|nr:endolytic transglycosylase MltG [Myxococcota bacterium]